MRRRRLNPFEIVNTAKDYTMPVLGATSGLLASKIVPTMIKVENPYFKAGITGGVGILALYMGGKRGSDFATYAGGAMLAMGLLMLVKNFFPVSYQSYVLSEFPGVPVPSYVGAYPRELMTSQPALSDGMGMDGFSMDGISMDAYPHESAVPSY